LNSLKQHHKKTVLRKQGENLADFDVFIIDTIGILKIYSYADIAFVGGGLETGVHNLLEPATFGVPMLLVLIILTLQKQSH
jgi:3-deoxy-D-manno-octulosonic-acid transferase